MTTLRPLLIGATETPAVCGLSPWATALDVYLRLTGQAVERPASEAMRLGLLLEPVVSQLYTERTGLALEPCEPHQTHPDHPHLMASPDRLATDGRLVELKTAGWRNTDEWGPEGSDSVPDHYLLQVQQQMLISGRSVCDVAALIGGQELRVYTVPRNESVIRSLVAITEAFWARVQRREPPEPDWRHPHTPELIAGLYGCEGGECWLVGGDAEIEADKYRLAGEVIKDQEMFRAEAKARLIHMLGGHGVGYLPDGRILRRSRVTRKGYSVEESSYYDFRILKARKR